MTHDALDKRTLKNEALMLKLGHRGAPGYPRRFENTIYSFWRALQLGADGFELDVRRCKNKLVVFHDKTLEHATNGFSKSAIADMEHEELDERIFQARGLRQGFHIPLLSEVLSAFGSRCFINIELKESYIWEDVFWLVQKFGLSQTVLISCFDKTKEALSEENAPSWSELSHAPSCVHTALIASTEVVKKMGDDYIACAKELGASAIHPHRLAINKKLIKNAKTAGIHVNAWTVNNRYAIWKMRRTGVHGIISDFPERL